MSGGVANWVLQNKHQGFSQAVWQEGEVVDRAWFRCSLGTRLFTSFLSLSLSPRGVIFKLQELGSQATVSFEFLGKMVDKKQNTT